MQRAAWAAIAIAGLTALPAMAEAKAGDKRADITASVKEVCRFDAPTLFLPVGATMASGQAFEACNSARSYKLTAVTRQLDLGEALILGYGSILLDLDIDGSTLISQSRGPVFRMVDMRLEATALSSPVSITMSMSVV